MFESILFNLIEMMISPDSDWIGSALGQRARYGIAESGWNTTSVAFPSLNVVVLKPTFCQMPRTLARWLKGGSGQLRCDCEIKS